MDLVPTVRHFNRQVTLTIGALDDHYLGRDRPLGESRLLFEIGTDGATAADLRARLGLDSGYLSRLLRSLEKQKLVATSPLPDDRRVRTVRLTAGGRKELDVLNRDSDCLAESLLAPLSESQRRDLGEAMDRVSRLLAASTVRIDETAATGRDAQHCLAEYYRELAERFDTGFDPDKSLAPSLAEFAPPRGSFLVMRMAGEPVGCGGLKPISARAAYLKRMWIAPQARGLGLARRLLALLEDKARALGYRTVKLETNKALTEAQQLYRSSGYREVAPFNDEPYAHHWFEKRIRP
jgi:DNA-binding MarR family transcriptional regulator/GNAT superfamily N-acetyltransferase